MSASSEQISLREAIRLETGKKRGSLKAASELEGLTNVTGVYYSTSQTHTYERKDETRHTKVKHIAC